VLATRTTQRCVPGESVPMTKPVSPELNDLSDDDIVSTQLEPPTSLIAATGIVFQGLERSDPVPIRQWIGGGDAHATTRAKHGR
jgi:hypothetical protein